MQPTTGLVIDGFSGRKPTPAERKLAEQAAKRGLFLLLYSFTGDDGEQIDSRTLGLEEFVENKLFCYEMELPSRTSIWPEALDHYEKLLHAGIEREKEKHARFKWWEHVSTKSDGGS